MAPGRGCDGDIGKAGRMTGCARLVCQFSRQAGRRNIERQHPLSIKMEHEFKPIPEAGGPGSGAGPFHLGNPVGDFGYGHRR